MISFKKIGVMIALSLLLVQNTALACNCGSKTRYAVYKPYQLGKYNQYYNDLSHYYLKAASELSADGHEKASGYLFHKASRAQQGHIRMESAPRSSSEYKEIDNARKLLTKYSTHKNMGIYPRQLAAAHFYYDKWVLAEKYMPSGSCSNSARAHFYKYINIIVNSMNDGDNILEQISINQSKHMERYFTKSNLVGTMYFPFDNHKHILNTDKNAIIDDAKMTVSKDYILVVSGNADKVGTQEYNIRLSVQRAETVRDKLIASGIDAGSVKIVAFGENRVSQDFGTLTYDDSANRRVEIYAIHTSKCGGTCGQS